MNDAGRGFSVESHAAAGAPFDWIRGRARRPRFFSGSGARAGGAGRAGVAEAGGAGTAFAAFVSAGFAAAAFGATGFAAGFAAGAAFAGAGFAAAAFLSGAATFATAFLTAFAAARSLGVGFDGLFGAALAGARFFAAGLANFLAAGDFAAGFALPATTFFFAVLAVFRTAVATFFAARLAAGAAFFPCALAMKDHLRPSG